MKVRDTNLVVNVVVVGVVGAGELERVPGELVPAVVVDRLQRAEDEEEQAGAGGHHCDLVSESGASGVKNESFHWMVVKCAVGVRDVESVVPGVPMGC